MQRHNTVGYISPDIEIALTSSYDGSPYGQKLVLLVTSVPEQQLPAKIELTSFAELRAFGEAILKLAEKPKALHLVEEPEGTVARKSRLSMAKVSGWQVPFDLPVVVTTAKGLRLRTDVADMSECLARDNSLRNLAAVARPATESDSD